MVFTRASICRRALLLGVFAVFGVARAGMPAMAQDRPFLIFFDYGSVLVTPEAQKVLDFVVGDLKSGKAKSVSIVGHTDTAEEAPSILSLARGQAIASVLMAKGIALDKLQIAASGAQSQMVPTGPQTKEPMNRRAELISKR